MTHARGNVNKGGDLMSKNKKVNIEPTETNEPINATEPINGVVINCARLRVRQQPSVEAIILGEINEGSDLLINEEESTQDFYKVYTAAGIEGYCVKKFIEIK